MNNNWIKRKWRLHLVLLYGCAKERLLYHIGECWKLSIDVSRLVSSLLALLQSYRRVLWGPPELLFCCQLGVVTVVDLYEIVRKMSPALSSSGYAYNFLMFSLSYIRSTVMMHKRCHRQVPRDLLKMLTIGIHIQHAASESILYARASVMVLLQVDSDIVGLLTNTPLHSPCDRPEKWWKRLKRGLSPALTGVYLTLRVTGHGCDRSHRTTNIDNLN